MDKLIRLTKAVAGKKRLLVLFSGGLDSTVLARVARDALGEESCALTFASRIVPVADGEEALRVARSIGIRHVVVESNELDDPDFVSNPPERCFICRRKRDAIASGWAADNGFDVIADGMNASDLSDYRPGLAASREDGIWQPFVELGMTKDDIRRAAAALGIEDPHRPSTVCLCSRIPWGMRIEEALLRRIEAAEAFVRGLGFRQVRVRCFPYDTAIVQVEDQGRLLGMKGVVTDRLRDLGFSFVCLDLEGFTSGSLNRIVNGSVSRS